MKQFVIAQMKEYQHKKEIIKAIKYQEGMEDAWMVEYERYIEDNEGTTYDMVKKVFKSKEEARKYMASPTDESIMRYFSKYTKVVPVLLHEISKDEYEEDYGYMVSALDGEYYEYEPLLEPEDCWLVLDKNGYVHGFYDTEEFFETYECLSCAHIGYDVTLEEFYVEMNCIRIAIEKTEVATVEKLLDGFEISFTERIGQAFAR